VVSNSWGSGAEFTGENSFDADFSRPGVAIVAAGGDSGYGTQYPAASQFVTAVGGTTLTGATSSNPGTQRVWGGTGSGCSSLEARPSWQTSADLARRGCRNRAQNDVSADADPLPGVAVSDSFGTDGAVPGWAAVGGTSVSTPIIASVYALAGNLLPGTYPSSYPYLDSSGLADVTSGSNGSCELYRRYLCHARSGYDGPAGLGTPSGTGSFAAPSAPAVTVADPGTRDYQAGSSVRLRLHAIDSGQDQLRYLSRGLPAGLRLDSSDGVISGRLPSRPGTHRVRATATDAAGGSGSVRFDIVVVARIADRHPGSGPVRLRLDDKCLTDSGDSAASGTRIEISTCDSEAAQDWEYIPFASPGAPGLVKIHGKCLSVESGTSDGARSTLRPCDGSAGQRWAYQTLGHLYNPRSAKCLADPGKSRKNGTQVELWSCSSAAGQSWMLPPGPVLSGMSGKCLADPGGSASPGTPIVIASCSGGRGQKWVLTREGALRIRGRCLNVARGGRKDGAAAVLADCSHSTSEQWFSGPGGELLNGNSGRCLADPANKTASGTRLVQEDCYGRPGEIWTVS
jgi:Ricin-type beta-trefoil lectin domain/Putative Ig domain/Subtilase family